MQTTTNQRQLDFINKPEVRNALFNFYTGKTDMEELKNILKEYSYLLGEDKKAFNKYVVYPHISDSNYFDKFAGIESSGSLFSTLTNLYPEATQEEYKAAEHYRNTFIQYVKYYLRERAFINEGGIY